MFSVTQPETLRQRLTAVRMGDAGIDSLDAWVREALKEFEPWAREVTDCTRAPVVGDERGLGPFAPWGDPRESISAIASQNAAKALQVTGWGTESEMALSDCADTLALARDVALDKGLVGAMVASSVVKLGVPACAHAIDNADDRRRRRFIQEVRLIRSGLPSFADILVIEKAQMQLVLFGDFLWAADQERLTSNALGLARSQLSNASGGGAKYFKSAALWLFWGGYVAKLDRMIEASRTKDRDTVLAEVDANPELAEQVVGWGLPGSNWLGFAHRYDLLLRIFDLLESAALARLGEDPLAGVQARPEDGRTILTVAGTDAETISITTRRPARE